MFDIDPRKYRVIDISYKVVPGQNPDRPFDMAWGTLFDGARKCDITRTHTHVGTHVESAAHFYDDGTPIDQYPLDSFYGRGVLLNVDLPDTEKHITAEHIDSQIGDIVRAGDIIVCRHARGGVGSTRYFTDDAALYFRDKAAKMIVLGDGVSMGETIDQGNRFHDILMRNTTFLEIVSGLDQITRREFFVVALPILVEGLDSSWCRAVVIEET